MMTGPVKADREQRAVSQRPRSKPLDRGKRDHISFGCALAIAVVLLAIVVATQVWPMLTQ